MSANAQIVLFTIIPLLALGWEITSLLLVARAPAAAANASRRPWRGSLEARVPARTEGPHVPSMAYALEGMGPLFKMRRTDSAWHTRAAWGAAHVGTAHVGHVRATGRAAHIRMGAKTSGAATFFRAAAGATARLRASAKFATTLERRRLVSTEIASHLGRRAHASELLTQRRIPIEHAPAMEWIVVRDVDYFWPRRLDHDGLALLGHADLVGRLEVADLIRLLTQVLDRVHHQCLLGEKRIAEPFRPAQLLVHHLEDLGKRNERFDAGIPSILFDRPHGFVAFEVGIGSGPTRGLDDLERIRRGHQNLRQQRVRVQRDWRQHLIELLLRKRPTWRRRILLRHRHCFLGEHKRHGQQQHQHLSQHVCGACFHKSPSEVPGLVSLPIMTPRTAESYLPPSNGLITIWPVSH